MNSRVNSQFVIATLAEFVRVWDLGEDASLHLETTKGHATMAFNCKLGPPTAPHPIPNFPPPPPPAQRPRHHRGPAQREKNRQRAARYQASKCEHAAATAVTSPTILPTTASVVTNSIPTTTFLVSTPITTVPVTTSSTTASPVLPSASSRTADPAVAPSLNMCFENRVKVYGFPFALVPELKNRTDRKLPCDKCPFSDTWLITRTLSMETLRIHRQEKHRIWECLCCGTAFTNSIDFKKHIDKKNCVLHRFGMPYLGCGSDDPIPF